MKSTSKYILAILTILFSISSNAYCQENKKDSYYCDTVIVTLKFINTDSLHSLKVDGNSPRFDKAFLDSFLNNSVDSLIRQNRIHIVRSDSFLLNVPFHFYYIKSEE